jgi:single-strand DNA-binding protein
MSSFNQVLLIGNISTDLELKRTSNDKAYIKFNLATNNRIKNADGEMIEQAEFHRIAFWGKKAETIHQYCKKGDKLFVRGRLVHRSWENDKGEKQYITEVMGLGFQFLTPKSDQKESEPDNELAADVDEILSEGTDQEDIPF